MRVTKVNGYKTRKDTKRGYVINENNKDIEKNDFKNLEHIKSHTILNKAFEKGIYQDKKSSKKLSEEKRKEINKKRKAIRAFVSKLVLENENLKFKGNKEFLNTSIKEIASCDFPEDDIYGQLSIDKIISFSFKNKALKQFYVHIFIAGLVKIYIAKAEIDFSDFQQQYYEVLQPKIERHDKKIEKIYQSIQNNKIQSIQSKDLNEKGKFYESLLDKIMDDSEFYLYIEILSERYELEQCIKQIRDLYKDENLKKQRTYDRNSRIKKVLQTHQKELMKNDKFYDDKKRKRALKFYDDEVVAYFHRHFPVKRKQKMRTNNHNKIDYLNTKRIKTEIILQMKNKVITHFITKGKHIRYAKAPSKLIDKVNSQDLEIMHIEDVFSRKLSSSITYAVNGFRNELFNEYQISCLKIKFYFLGKEINSKSCEDLFKTYMKKNDKAKMIDGLNALKEYQLFINDIDVLINKIKDSDNLSHLIGEVFQLRKQFHTIEKKSAKLIDNIKDFQNKDFLLDEEKGKINKIIDEMHDMNLLIKFKDNDDNSNISALSSDLYKFTRNAMFAFRNTSFHDQAIKTEFLSGKEKEIKYLEKHIDKKLSIIPEMEILKAYHNGVFHYFKHEDIFDLYEKDKLYVPRDNTKMPQFKKIMKTFSRIEKYGLNALTSIKDMIQSYEKASAEKTFIDNLSISKKQAVRYLLLKIYYGHTEEIKKEAILNLDKFLSDKKVLDHNDHFENIKNINKKVNEEKKEKLCINYSEHYQDLMSAIQSDKEKYEEDKWKECKLAYDFINELTAKAFMKILEQKKYQFIFTHENLLFKCEKESILEKFEAFKKDHPETATIDELKIQHNQQENLLYAFYAMLLFLSKARLSELNNNIAGYKQAVSKLNPNDSLNKKLFNKMIEIESIEKVLGILIATYEREPIDDKKYAYILKKFLHFDHIEDLEEYNPPQNIKGRQQLYIQKRKTVKNKDENLKDKSSKLVQFRQIIEADREDLIKRYEKYYEDKRITKEEVYSFYELEKQIQAVIKKMEDKKAIIKNSTHQKHTIKQEYTDLFIKRKEYEQLKNHILFNNVSKMNRLLVDVYSRLNGLLAVAEKDLYNLKEGLEVTCDNIYQYFQKETDLNIIKITDKDIRNKIAHFEYMRKTEAVRDVTFIEQLNRLRDFLKFDRKLKNAVTKTVINTFEKQGYNLRFKFKKDNTAKKHRIISYKLEAKPINDQYLTKDYKNNYWGKNDDKFLEMIKAIIFEGDYDDNNINSTEPFNKKGK